MNFIKIPLFLAIRSIKRSNKWTLLLIFSLIAIAFINMIFMTSLFNGIIEMSNNQIIDTYTGHITLTPKDGDSIIKDRQELLGKINKTENVIASSSQLVVPANMEYKNIKLNVPTFAVRPSEELKVTNISKRIKQGSYLNDDEKYQIILGQDLAGGEDANMSNGSMKGAKVGDKVNLNFNGKKYEFTVAGIFWTKFMFSDRLAFINQKTWEEINPAVVSNSASLINVRLDDKKNAYKVIDDFKSQGIGANFDRWEESLSFMKSINSTFVILRALLTIIGAIIAAVTIFIVIYIDISNRRRQIGILRAIGISPIHLRISYVFQVLFYAIVGIAVGSLIFIYGFMPYFAAHPLTFPLGDSQLVVDQFEFYIKVLIILAVAIISGFVPSYFVTKNKILNVISGK